MMDLAHGVSFREPLLAACPHCGKVPDVKIEWIGTNTFVLTCGCRRWKGESYTGLWSCGVEAAKLRALAQTAVDWNVNCSLRRYLIKQGHKFPVRESEIREEGGKIFVKRPPGEGAGGTEKPHAKW